MKKVLVLTNSIDGFYSFRRELIQKLLQNDYEVGISAPKGNRTGYFREIGCSVIETEFNRRSKNPFSDLKLLFFYVRTIRKISPGIVLTYTIKPNVYGGIACRYTKIPYISNITGLGTSIENKGITRKISLLLYKTGLKNSRKIFFQNSSNLKVFKEANIVKKGHLLPGSGINLEYFHYEEYPKETETLKFLFIGRIMKNKGIEEFLEAIKIVKERHQNAEFHILGECEEEYKEDLEKFETSQLVVWHGQKKDVRPFIKNSHAIINPSYHEGMSNVLLEAAAMGRPILASDVPGCKETLDDGVSGFLFETKNAKSLADYIEKFIALKHEEKVAMGIAGRKKMEKEFDRNIVIEAYCETIKRVIGNH